MKAITIFVEGGGPTARTGQQILREGFDAILATQKTAARRKNLRWQLGLYGSRNEAFKAFRNATSRKQQSDIAVLLVDSEEPVADATPEGRVAHLHKRDHWTLDRADPCCVHLMIQCMEAWIISDTTVLEGYYGNGFRKGVLPKRQRLDEEPKQSLYDSLKEATKDTQKGCYDKTKHASELLKRIRPSVVTEHCTSFRQLTQ